MPPHRIWSSLCSAPKSLFPVLSDPKGEAMQALILDAKAHQDSIGGTIECVTSGLPMGLGAPDFDRNAETEYARQLFAIPAIKGLEFGDASALAGCTAVRPTTPGP